MREDNLIRAIMGTSSASNWIRFPAFVLVFIAGIMSIVGSLFDEADPQPGIDVVWELDLSVRDALSSPAIDNDGTIYVGTTFNTLYAISRDGKEKWRFSTNGPVLTSPAIGSDGTIFAGSSDNNFYAINPDGTEKWLFSTGGSVRSSAAIGSDGILYVGSFDNNLYAIYPDGTEKWRFSTNDSVYASPAIGCDGTIYVGSYDDNLYAINPDGTEKWRFAAGGGFTSSPAIGRDGILYVGSYDDNLYAINPDGIEKWHYETDDSIDSSPAIGSDGTIYVGSNDRHLYAISPEGGLKWRFGEDGAPIISSPAIGNDGTIYFGAYDLYAINPDGSKKQSYDLPFTDSSPTIGDSGILFILTESKLIAVDVASDRLADTPWPKFRNNLKQTGRTSTAGVPGNANAAAGDSQVVVSWDSTTDASSYNIYWSTSPGVTTSDTRISGVTSPHSVVGLTNGTTYYFVVTTESTCGESGISSEVSATPEFAGAYSVVISPGDGPTGSICPDTTIFTANVTGGLSPYTYSWTVTTTEGAGFDIISPVDEQTLEVCPWDSVTRGTIEVTVTDSNSDTTLDNIDVSAF